MLRADFDLGQVFIIVIAVLAGFLQWVWKLIQQGREERQRRDHPSAGTEEEPLREDAWRRQVQPPESRPPPTATPPPLHDPWGTVREVFDKMKEEMRKTQEEMERKTQPSPPPLPPSPPAPQPQLPPRPPARVRPGTVRADWDRSPESGFPRPPAPPPMPVPVAPVLVPVLARDSSTAAGPPTVSRARSNAAGLRAFLHDPASLRQAILLQEILGPPKALQSAGDAPI